jgi:hypothetical protein
MSFLQRLKLTLLQVVHTAKNVNETRIGYTNPPRVGAYPNNSPNPIPILKVSAKRDDQSTKNSPPSLPARTSSQSDACWISARNSRRKQGTRPHLKSTLLQPRPSSLYPHSSVYEIALVPGTAVRFVV